MKPCLCTTAAEPHLASTETMPVLRLDEDRAHALPRRWSAARTSAASVAEASAASAWAVRWAADEERRPDERLERDLSAAASEAGVVDALVVSAASTTLLHPLDPFPSSFSPPSPPKAFEVLPSLSHRPSSGRRLAPHRSLYLRVFWWFGLGGPSWIHSRFCSVPSCVFLARLIF
jgi:hypothetical protein